MSEVEKRLHEMGIAIPDCPKPVASYIPASVMGDCIFVSGQTPLENGLLKFKGKVGEEVSVQEGYEAARLCVIRLISELKTVADLDKIRIIKVNGYVNSGKGFGDQPKVINGASDLLEAAFLENGKHARAALGVSALPDDASVEVELIAAKL